MKAILVALWFGIAAHGSVVLTGSGSTFVAPMVSKWSGNYQKSHPDVHIDYRAVGSGEGIVDAIAGMVDFGRQTGR